MCIKYRKNKQTKKQKQKITNLFYVKRLYVPVRGSLFHNLQSFRQDHLVMMMMMFSIMMMLRIILRMMGRLLEI
jgi:hypothetical protein